MTTLNDIHPLGQQAPDRLVEPLEAPREYGRRDTNLGTTERTLSAAAGVFLALAGLSRRSLGGVALAAVGGGLIYRGVSGWCHLYEALGIDRSASDAPAPTDYFEHGIHVAEAFTINKAPWELYDFWRNFENLPKIMSHLESVRCIDGKRSHWVAKAPAIAGGKVEWDAEIINDEPGALIAWRSLANADVDNAGSVRFVPAPDGRGTDVKVVIDYIPPAGRVGSWVASLFGEAPQIQIAEDLRKLKQIMESGEFATIQGQTGGACGGSGGMQE